MILDELVELEPKDANIRYDLGDTFVRLGKPIDAVGDEVRAATGVAAVEPALITPVAIVATDGSYSAEVDGAADDATLTVASPIDLTPYGSAELTFDWYIESGFDSGEYVALDFSPDGSTWIEIKRLRGNVDQENTWHHETIELDFVAYDIEDPKMTALEALRTGETFSAALYVTFKLKDETGTKKSPKKAAKTAETKAEAPAEVADADEEE